MTTVRDYMKDNMMNANMSIEKCEQDMNKDPGNKNKQIIAYSYRDYIYNKNENVNNLFDKYCKKIGLSDTDEQIENMIKMKFINHLNHIIMSDEDIPEVGLDKMYESYKSNYMEEFGQTITNNRERYNKIMNMINNDYSLYHLYDQFTKKELDIIGW
tara:strand:+ start:162 stop:632 length:471 start_codon:yes stop_codon:yes gene_type:complete